MVEGFPLAATPTGLTDTGGWTLLPIPAFPGVALLAGVVTIVVLAGRGGRRPGTLLSLVVPLSAFVATLVAIVAWGGPGAVSTTGPGGAYLFIALSVGGAVLAGSSLSPWDRPALLIGTILFAAPLLVGPAVSDGGTSLQGFVTIGVTWGIVSICVGFLVGRWTTG